MSAHEFHRHCLAGRFFTDSSPPSKEECEISLRRQWDLSEDHMKVFALFGDTAIVFQFRGKKVKRKVLEEGPWYVNGFLLVLKDWSFCLDTNFTVTLFWVNVLGLPLICYGGDRASRAIRKVSNYTFRVYIDASKRIFRVLAEIDLKRPLNHGFCIDEHRFARFSYQNLGKFCYNCGMVNHIDRDCKKLLRRLDQIPKYGPWLRQGKELPDRVEVWFSEHEFEKTELEETLPCAQFFIELSIEEVYESENMDEGTKPRCFVSRELLETRFRLPCGYLETPSESGDYSSKAYEVIAKMVKEDVPFSMNRFVWMNWPVELSKTTSNDIKQDLVDYLWFIKKREGCRGRKWLHLQLHIHKVTKLTFEDYKTTLEARRIAGIRDKVEQRISDMIRRRVQQNNENLESMALWVENIKHALSGFILIPYPFNVVERAERARTEASALWASMNIGPKPADEAAVLELVRGKVRGNDMDRLGLCTICMEELFLGEEAITMPCSHVFHACSIETWLRNGHKCPLCGSKLPCRE